ncbi:MAG TPA: cytochrome c [Terracidiphilus sp.]|nr:cytochrome c [Terracidiphilus sp.]
MLKPFLVLSAVVLFVIAAPTPAPTLAAGRMPQEAAPTPASTNPVKPTPASQEKAKDLYARDCALCHGDNGNGKTGLAKDMGLTLSDWTDPKKLANKSDHELFDAIRKGKDKMPPEDPSRAKDDEVWNLIIYIRGLSKDQPAAAPPADAAKPGN